MIWVTTWANQARNARADLRAGARRVTMAAARLLTRSRAAPVILAPFQPTLCLKVVRTTVARTTVARTTVVRPTAARTTVVRTTVARTIAARIIVAQSTVVRTTLACSIVARITVVCITFARITVVCTTPLRTQTRPLYLRTLTGPLRHGRQSAFGCCCPIL